MKMMMMMMMIHRPAEHELVLVAQEHEPYQCHHQQHGPVTSPNLAVQVTAGQQPVKHPQ
jgi:hypothetical protein